MSCKPQNPFVPTPLAEKLAELVFGKKDPNTFAIVNMGSGPVLCYRSHRSYVREFTLELWQGGKSFYLDQESKPPYLIMLAQEEPGLPANITIYCENPNPVLEYSFGDRPLAGQIVAYSMSPNGQEYTVVHTLYSPIHNATFTVVDKEFRGSTAIADHAALCRHLLFCGKTISFLMDQFHRKDESEEGKVV